MTLEEFIEKFEDLELSEKMQLYNEYAIKKDDPDTPVFYYISEQFFVDNFTSFMQLAEKIGERGIDMGNNIIYIDRWGDLETISDDSAEENIECFADGIYEHPEIWKHYIKEA